MAETSTAGVRARWHLGVASLAVMLAAADTYVVVIALTAIMSDLGISITDLDRATPIISGFLVGYVAMLPLLGRLSDLHGREPVFQVCLLVFAIGSLISASSVSLPEIVIGRGLQGMGGGGMVPITLALVADRWPVERRSLPLGIVAGVQELGSMLGPLYGAALLAVGSWRLIFWINLPLALLLSIGLRVTRATRLPSTTDATVRTPPVGHRDIIGAVLLLLGCAAAVLAITAPQSLQSSVSIGVIYSPLFNQVGVNPVALSALGLLLLAAVWERCAPSSIRVLVPLRRTGELLRRSDWLGALLLIIPLALLVLSFAAADPTTQVLSSGWQLMLPAALLLLLAFGWHEQHTTTPLIRLTALRDRAALGAMLANLGIGAALMAALVDVPLFARATTFTTLAPAAAQLQAALLLVRLLIAIPIGALIGGAICNRLGYRVTAAIAMTLATAGLLAMTTWQPQTLTQPLLGTHLFHPSDVALAVAGLGFGLAIAPINAATLSAVGAEFHGVAAALVVMARTIGMLIGLSLLTAIGLHHFYGVLNGRCPDVVNNCSGTVIIGAVTEEIHAIFAGAAICAAAAGVIGLACLRRPSGARPGVVEMLGGA